MKKMLVVLVIATMFTLASASQSTTVTTQVYSQYLGGNGAIFYDAPVLQVDVLTTWKSGLYVDLWRSFGANFGNENDVSIGWSRDLPGARYFNVEVLYIDAWPAGSVKNNFVSPRVEFGKSIRLNSVLTLTHYLRLENYQPQRWVSETSAGNLVFLGTKLSGESPNKMLSWSANLRLLYDSGAFASDSGYLMQLNLHTEVKFVKNAAFTIDVKSSKPLTTHDSRKGEVAAGVGLVYRF